MIKTAPRLAARALLAVMMLPGMAMLPAHAGELLVGKALSGSDSPLAFQLTGKNPDDVVGGEIILGESSYTIEKVSQRGMIGANRLHNAGEDSYGEFAVFSSSFSDQTAVGQPWVAANDYHHCDEPYNSFLAIYRVNGKQAVTRLGPMPYPTLTLELGSSNTSTVYCFMSTKGADHKKTQQTQ